MVAHNRWLVREYPNTPKTPMQKGGIMKGQVKRQRDNRVFVHLNDDELERLNKIVDSLPYNREQYIRAAIFGADIYQNPPAEYGEIIRELRRIGSNVYQILVKARQIKFIDEVMVCDLYNTVLDMDEKFSGAFTSKRYPKKVSELWQ